nr:uncharacterized protein LOC108400078 [Manis javanica]
MTCFDHDTADMTLCYSEAGPRVPYHSQNTACIHGRADELLQHETAHGPQLSCEAVRAQASAITFKFVVVTRSQTLFEVCELKTAAHDCPGWGLPGRRESSGWLKGFQISRRRAAGGTRMLRRATPRAFGESAREPEGAGLGGNRKAKVRRAERCAGASPGLSRCLRAPCPSQPRLPGSGVCPVSPEASSALRLFCTCIVCMHANSLSGSWGGCSYRGFMRLLNHVRKRKIPGFAGDVSYSCLAAWSMGDGWKELEISPAVETVISDSAVKSYHGTGVRTFCSWSWLMPWYGDFLTWLSSFPRMWRPRELSRS